MTSSFKRRVVDAIDQRRSELIELCSQVIRIPSVNPPGDTREIVAFTSDWLRSCGLEPRLYAPKEDRPNIVASVEGPAKGPHFVFNSHLDEFPATDAGWTYPPFGGVVAEGRVYGRGASDMKAGLAASLFIARLVGGDLPIPGRMTFSFSSDEESGGRWGTTWLLDNVPDVRGDACLIGDQLGTWAIGVAEKGVFWNRVTARGEPGHAAYGSAGSANRKLIDALQIALEFAGTKGQPNDELAAIIAAQRPEMGRWGRQAEGLIDAVSVNIGAIHGGVSPNLVADSAEALVDFRLPVGRTTDALLADYRDRLARRGVDGIEVTPFSQHEPSYTSTSHQLVKCVQANTATARGSASIPVIRLGASDARLFRAHGVPTVVYGPEAYNMGGVDESITVEDLMLTTLVHAGTAIDFLEN